MTIKDRDKFRQYYIGIFKALHTTGRTYFAELKTPEEKAEAVLNTGYWDVKILPLSLAKAVDKLGYLNVGICPICGDSPIGQSSTWKYSWSWNYGPTLYLCKSCFDIEIQEYLERNKNRKKGCYIATVCYEDPLSDNVYILKWYRDNILSKSTIGNIFIDSYYFLSPTVAHFLKNKKLLNRIIKYSLINPIITHIRRKYTK